MTMTSVYGPAGVATHVRDPAVIGPSVVDAWLVFRPQAHPEWDQYLVVVAHLRPLHGLPEPHPAFDGATHALAVTPLAPSGAAHTEQSIRLHGPRVAGPANIVHHFEGTDEEIARLGAFVAVSITDGRLFPETTGRMAEHADDIRMVWLGKLVRYLAHLRGEQHA